MRRRREPDGLPRFCREVRDQLPAYLGGDLSGWSARTMRRHLRRCHDCATVRDSQLRVDETLSALRAGGGVPPEGLLDDLLERARSPRLRERAAVPVRGAVSGARPGLSVAFLTVGAAASTGVGWAVWRAAHWAGRRVARRR